MQYPRSTPPPVALFGPWNSNTAEGNCVEIALGPEGWVGVRDSKDEELGPVLRFTPGEWAAFKDGLANGKLA
jgi:hypothetical protein